MKSFFAILCVLLMTLTNCTEEETTDQLPFILLNQGDEYTADGDWIPVGGQLKFGLSVVGGGAAITDLRVKRILEDEIVTELDKGMYIPTGGLDTTLTYTKSDADRETWNFFMMNENRDTASVYITIFKGDGSAYGEIFYYPSIKIGYPANDQFAHFLDLNTGTIYNQDNVAGHEQDIDLAAFFYVTSGKSSPTLTCPAYPSAQTWYPVFSGWSVKNSTLYDYKTSDNDLVSIAQFDAAENDSLLVAGYKPQNVSGLCKFCYTNKVIPFKTAGGKYGMVKVIRADELEGGSMEIAVKIQR
jgi:WD40 repeat protein